MVFECIGLLYEHLVHFSFLPRLSDSNFNIKQGENTITINKDVNILKIKLNEII